MVTPIQRVMRMVEEWRDIKGAHYYQVSNYGRVRKLAHTKTDKNGVRYNIKQRYLKGTVCKDGYNKVHIHCLGKVQHVHRLVMLTFVGQSNKRTVNHKDGNKLNNKLDNLEWATDGENVRHGFKNGLFSSRKGERNNQSKITKDQAKQIKELKGIKPQSEVAKMFGISKGHVCNIQRGHNWRENEV